MVDKDRIKGSAQQAKGKVKEVAGKATGDAELETRPAHFSAAGNGAFRLFSPKSGNAIGGIKDAQ